MGESDRVKCEACDREIEAAKATYDVTGCPLCPECSSEEPRYSGALAACSGCGMTWNVALDHGSEVEPKEPPRSGLGCPKCGYRTGEVVVAREYEEGLPLAGEEV